MGGHPAARLALIAIPSGAGAVLAVLLGVNIGPNLTYTGSLATLLGGWSTLTDTDTTDRSVVIWICEGTWRASVDAALSLAPAPAKFTLLHVTSDVAADAAHGAYLGLLGRGRARPRLGPKSLGKATRFVVDHAARPVLLVWPGSAPDVGTIPPPPHRPHHGGR